MCGLTNGNKLSFWTDLECIDGLDGLFNVGNFLMCLNIFKKKGARVTEHQNKDKTKKNNKNSFDNL